MLSLSMNGSVTGITSLRVLHLMSSKKVRELKLRSPLVVAVLALLLILIISMI